jgi:hypothetical protein
MVMPGMVGGFGNINFQPFYFKNSIMEVTVIETRGALRIFTSSTIVNLEVFNKLEKNKVSNSNFEKLDIKGSMLGSYLAGLIEGDGSIAVDEKKMLKVTILGLL